eukprot:COSAG01_NODE_43681_length_427_cov_0.960366_1_plen_20_part_10
MESALSAGLYRNVLMHAIAW